MGSRLGVMVGFLHYPLVPVVNIVSAVLIMLSMINASARRSWNTGVLMLGTWVLVMCIIIAVDAIVWADNANDSVPVWCDISMFSMNYLLPILILGLFLLDKLHESV